MGFTLLNDPTIGLTGDSGFINSTAISSIPATNSGGSDFLSTIGSAFGGLLTGAANVANQVLPIWTAQALNAQQKNQLVQPVYVGTNGQIQTTTGSIANSVPAWVMYGVLGIAAVFLIVTLTRK